MGLTTMLYIGVVCLLAMCMQRISGFGFAILAMIVLPYLMDSYIEAATLSVLISFVSNCALALRYGKHVRWKLLLPVFAGSFVTIIFALHISAVSSFAFLEKLLGVTLILTAVFFAFFSKRIHIRPNTGSGLIVGGLSGMLSGLFSTGGPPVALYMFDAAESFEVYFATIQAFFACSNLFSLILRAGGGFVTENVLKCAAFGIAGAALGNFLGKAAGKKIDKCKVRYIVLGIMAFSGTLMLL